MLLGMYEGRALNLEVTMSTSDKEDLLGGRNLPTSNPVSRFSSTHLGINP